MGYNMVMLIKQEERIEMARTRKLDKWEKEALKDEGVMENYMIGVNIDRAWQGATDFLYERIVHEFSWMKGKQGFAEMLLGGVFGKDEYDPDPGRHTSMKISFSRGPMRGEYNNIADYSVGINFDNDGDHRVSTSPIQVQSTSIYQGGSDVLKELKQKLKKMGIGLYPHGRYQELGEGCIEYEVHASGDSYVVERCRRERDRMNRRENKGKPAVKGR